ncbi:hypothetical protein [Leifsonia sp. EB34]|uniref:hypothetical protein n=1 Tax=Leifsonia sp. EB34 TaxID=3156303 RepID=UPI003518F1E6
MNETTPVARAGIVYESMVGSTRQVADVVGVDGSQVGRLALEFAAQQAEVLRRR